MFTKNTLLAILGCCLLAAPATAATIHGPSPYLSLDDRPDGIFNPGAILHIEDFENPDGPWEECFSIDKGRRIGPKFISGDGVPVTDSVDADDNAIDGDGTMGSSWFSPNRNLTITFDDATQAAGFVLTDADKMATKVTIDVFGDGGALLATKDFVADFLDDVFTGTTQEDRFFGVTAMANEAIKRIKISIDAGTGIEIDHVQFEKIPEPASMSLALMGLIGMGTMRRRRR